MGLDVLRRSNLTLLVLGLLKQQPMHGYGICRAVRDRSDNHIINELRHGSLYPLLHQLEEQGLIEGYEVPNPRGHNRRLYRLTDRGEQVFQEELAVYKQIGRIIGVT
jgi:PadR family transcriptional regulator, regulatory protein PadR